MFILHHNEAPAETIILNVALDRKTPKLDAITPIIATMELEF